jgi:hypothetical protein
MEQSGNNPAQTTIPREHYWISDLHKSYFTPPSNSLHPPAAMEHLGLFLVAAIPLIALLIAWPVILKRHAGTFSRSSTTGISCEPSPFSMLKPNAAKRPRACTRMTPMNKALHCTIARIIAWASAEVTR